MRPTRDSFFARHSRTFFTLLFLIGYSVTITYATPPGSPYTPGETLDPTCAPGGTNCTVDIGPTQWTTTGSDIYYDSGNVSIGSTTFTSLFNVGSAAQFRVNSSGAIVAATGITSSGTITFSGLSSGLVKSTSGTLSAATAGTDYENPLTFSTGLTRSTNTVTNDLSTGVSGGQTLIGSTSTTSGLTIKATTGVGTTGANIVFTGGNNGATEFGRFQTQSGVTDQLLVGTTTGNTGGRIYAVKNLTGQTAGSAGVIRGSDTSTYNTTAGAIPTYAGYFNTTGTKSAGGNNLINNALYLQAANGDINNAILVGGGNIVFDTGTSSARLHFGTAQSSAGTAPIKFTLGGSLMATPEAGAIEAINGSIYWTTSTPTRTNFVLNNLGLSGGQTIIGDTASDGNLTLQSTSNATRGTIRFGTGGQAVNSYYNEDTGKWSIRATSSPSGEVFYVDGNMRASSYIQTDTDLLVGQNINLTPTSGSYEDWIDFDGINGIANIGDINSNVNGTNILLNDDLGIINYNAPANAHTFTSDAFFINLNSGSTFSYVGSSNALTLGATELFTTASSTSYAGLNLGVGVAPTSPANGDVWLTSTHMNARIGGVTYQLDQQTPAINSLTAATGSNTINNANNAQTWQWNTLAGVSGLNLTSTSTAAASNAQKLLDVTLSGANSTSSQTTYAGYFSNTHTGTSSSNVALYATASGGTNNYSGIFDAGSVGIGDTTPDYLLDVANTGVDSNIFSITDSDGECLYNPESGSVTVSCSSDERLKTNITDTNSVLLYLSDFRIRDYEVLASGDHLTGVIAQEVLSIHPELVTTGSNGMYSVQLPNQWKIVKAIQELDLKIIDIRDLSKENTWRDALVAWFADVANGINKFFAGEIETNTLCVSDETGKTCITKSQLDALLEGQSITPSDDEGDIIEDDDQNETPPVDEPTCETDQTLCPPIEDQSNEPTDEEV